MIISRTTSQRGGFTLVELLVAMVIVSLLVVMLVAMTNSVGRIWTQSSAKAEQFRDAREAFGAIIRKVGEATLNPYLDYTDSTGAFRPANVPAFTPAGYKRRSELRFISGDAATLMGSSTTPIGGTLAPSHAIFFQAPHGDVTSTSYTDLQNVVNTVGYFIEYGGDNLLRPGFVNTPVRYRFRLMEMVETSDNLTLYAGPPNERGIKDSNGNPSYQYGTSGNPGYVGHDWFTYPFNLSPTATPPRPVSVLAENIVSLVILPQLSPADQAAGGYNAGSLAPTYFYDSTGTGMTTTADQNLDPVNQLPPVVQVTMVAVDEASFNRLGPTASMPTYTSNLFTSANFQVSPTQYQTDLNQLQANLLGKPYAAGGTTYTPATSHPPLNYRIFTTNVGVKAAKWSRTETDTPQN